MTEIVGGIGKRKERGRPREMERLSVTESRRGTTSVVMDRDPHGRHVHLNRAKSNLRGETIQNKKVLVITGPTAVGKTSTSIQIAKMLNGEIISADSVQVYRGLDIGSAKITKDEMDGVPHHCIDIMDPQEEFSAGLFHSIATSTIDEILERGKTPIVVGGTGFYLKWLIDGRPSTPASTKESEKTVQERLAACFEEKAHAIGVASVDMLTQDDRWLAGVNLVRMLGDEETADRLLYQEVYNWYRMNRVVDILLQAPGKTLADLDAESGNSNYEFRCFYLVRDRVEMYRRIDERVESMIMEGLLTETVKKLSHVEVNSNCATRAIGYRQTLMFFERMHRKKLEDIHVQCTYDDIIELVKDIQSASRQLCHKQMKWFRKEDKFRWINATGDSVNDILRFWNDEGCGESDGMGCKKARLTKEEERELRLYQPVMTRLTQNSPEVEKIIEEANDILDSMGSNSERE